MLKWIRSDIEPEITKIDLSSDWQKLNLSEDDNYAIWIGHSTFLIKKNGVTILTDPILPDLIKICSAVKFEGILLSYSLIGRPAQVILLGKSVNFVLGSITFSFNPEAIVKVLNTEPSSYTPFVTRLMYLTSFISSLLFKLKSGNESLTMNMSIRTNKSGHAGQKKLGQFSLSVKYNGLAK